MSCVSEWSVDPTAESLGSGHFLLRATARIERPLPVVFDVFAAAENLEKITPPELRFRIVTPAPIDMGKGTLIDYRLRLNGIPFSWRTEITEWDPPQSSGEPNRPPAAAFTDTQLRGPYHTWIHRHLFTAVDAPDGTPLGATEMVDEVRYRLPLWPLGAVALPVVRHQLRGIFAYRARILGDLFA